MKPEKTILVTGGAGYIGSHTVQELINKGSPVVVLDNLVTGHREAVQTPLFYQGDVADSALVEHIIKEHQVYSVIHFAARSQVNESVLKPGLYFYENTAKSFIFFETAIKAGVKHIVFSSTAAVYGMPEEVPIREVLKAAPINSYGASKRMIEEYLEWVSGINGVSWTALRYFNAAGASLGGDLGEDHRPETHLIPLILQTAMGRREKVAVFGTDYDTPDGTCIRDYLHVVDLARVHTAALQALEKGLRCGVFNVGTGKGFSIMEVIETAEAVTWRKLSVEYRERRNGDPPLLVADNRSTQRHLGWEPMYSDLETIISSAWQWQTTHPDGYNQ